MKVILAEHFGMCFGVRDAIAEAENLAGNGPLTILSWSIIPSSVNGWTPKESPRPRLIILAQDHNA
jgi:hypothetical protein